MFTFIFTGTNILRKGQRRFPTPWNIRRKKGYNEEEEEEEAQKKGDTGLLVLAAWPGVVKLLVFIHIMYGLFACHFAKCIYSGFAIYCMIVFPLQFCYLLYDCLSIAVLHSVCTPS